MSVDGQFSAFWIRQICNYKKRMKECNSPTLVLLWLRIFPTLLQKPLKISVVVQTVLTADRLDIGNLNLLSVRFSSSSIDQVRIICAKIDF